MKNRHNMVEKSIAPERLKDEAIEKIGEEFKNVGLNIDQDLEHFVLTVGERKIFIPKRKTINYMDGQQGMQEINIKEYIKRVIGREGLGNNG